MGVRRLGLFCVGEDGCKVKDVWGGGEGMSSALGRRVRFKETPRADVSTWGGCRRVMGVTVS